MAIETTTPLGVTRIETMTDDVRDYLLEYGFKQAVTDAGAPALAQAFESSMDVKEYAELAKDADALKAARKDWGKDNAETVTARRKELCQARLDQLVKGEVPAHGSGGGVSLTDWQREMYKAAGAAFRAGLDKLDRKRFAEKDRKEQLAILDEFIAKAKDKIDFEKQARATIAATRKLDIDISF